MVLSLQCFTPSPLPLHCPTFIFMRGAKVPAYLDPTPSLKLRSCPTCLLGGEESYFSYSYVLRNLSQKNVYMFLKKQRLQWLRAFQRSFSPDISPGMPGRRIKLFKVLPPIQQNLRVRVDFVSFRSFWPRNGKIKTDVCFILKFTRQPGGQSDIV